MREFNHKFHRFNRLQATRIVSTFLGYNPNAIRNRTNTTLPRLTKRLAIELPLYH